MDAQSTNTRMRNGQEFMSHKPPFQVLPTGTMAPFGAENTLFLHSAFWGLLLPVSVSQRVSDIWRGYWVQVGADLFDCLLPTDDAVVTVITRDFGATLLTVGAVCMCMPHIIMHATTNQRWAQPEGDR